MPCGNLRTEVRPNVGNRAEQQQLGVWGWAQLFMPTLAHQTSFGVSAPGPMSFAPVSSLLLGRIWAHD